MPPFSAMTAALVPPPAAMRSRPGSRRLTQRAIAMVTYDVRCSPMRTGAEVRAAMRDVLGEHTPHSHAESRGHRDSDQAVVQQ